MKIIFTNYFNQNSWLPDGGLYPELAALSNHFAKKHGYTTHFFGDPKSIDIIKNVEYDHITELSQSELDKIPKCLWSLSKFLSLQSINEPFLHLDIDLILKNNIDSKILNSEIIAFHTETYVLDKTESLQRAFPLHPLNRFDLTPLSYNCAIFGGQNFEYIKSKANFLLNFVYENKDSFDFLHKLYTYYIKTNKEHFYYPPVLVEQVWLYQLFKQDNKKIVNILGNPGSWSSLYKNSRKRRIVHLIGNYKMFYKNRIVKYVMELGLKY
ncbi:MAG: hypothetical protein RL736_5 [Pseudomonadota bacterium]|jgi:hypothetical protein